MGLQRRSKMGCATRKELWITSKLWNTYHRRDHVRAALDRTLNDLQLDYLDLYLMHFPIALNFVPFAKRYPPGWFFDPDEPQPHMVEDRVSIAETWEAMESLVQAGHVKHIGVCNFGCALLRDLLVLFAHPSGRAASGVSSATSLRRSCCGCVTRNALSSRRSRRSDRLSYVSLGMATDADSLLDHSVVRAIAGDIPENAGPGVAAMGRAASHRRHSQDVHTGRDLRENLAIFDFELSSDEMAQTQRTQSASPLQRSRRILRASVQYVFSDL